MLTSKVTMLIHKSKQVINLNNIEKYVDNSNQHSCVIIDTGISPHIDFCLGRNRIIAFVDMVNENVDVLYDDNGHGTFVAGVMCGKSISDKYSGIDTNCNIIVIKALDNAGETTVGGVLKAVDWVCKNKQKFNIKVVCMSFGSEVSGVDDPLISAVEWLWNIGIVVVCAGGNSGPNKQTIMSPGACRKVITVGALDESDGINFGVAEFSSRGPVFNYYKPDLVVPGVDIISTDIFGFSGKFYTKMSGTSVATPIVAGVASLLFKVNPNYTPDQIKYMLVKSCVPINGDRNVEGFGRLDLSRLKLL